MGRVILQRRTEEDWNLLVAMHRGWYPLVDDQVFRRFGPPAASRAPMAGRRTTAIRWTRRSAHLKSTFPLTTPEWSAWSATMRSAAHRGHLGRSAATSRATGPIFGTVTIAPGASPDEFTTEMSYHVRAERPHGRRAPAGR